MVQNIKAGYPINLYLSKWRLTVFLIAGGFCIWLGRLDILVAAELIIRTLAFLVLVFGIIFILTGCLILFNTAPNLTIRSTGLNHFALFKKGSRSHYYWKDIKNISLESQVLKHHRTWHLRLITKKGATFDIRLLPMKYESIKLNEKEIYHLIQQSFEGRRSADINDVPMRIYDRISLR